MVEWHPSYWLLCFLFSWPFTYINQHTRRKKMSAWLGWDNVKIWLGHADWIAMVVLATATTYVASISQSPAYEDGPTDDTWLKGISFFTVFCVRAVMTALILLPVLLILLCVWPAFRKDFMFRFSGSSRNAILIGIGLTVLGLVFYGRAYKLGLDADATRHLSAVVLILAPLFHKCVSSDHSKQWNWQNLGGIFLLAVAGTLIIDDDVRNN